MVGVLLAPHAYMTVDRATAHPGRDTSKPGRVLRRGLLETASAVSREP